MRHLKALIGKHNADKFNNNYLYLLMPNGENPAIQNSHWRDAGIFTLDRWYCYVLTEKELRTLAARYPNWMELELIRYEGKLSKDQLCDYLERTRIGLPNEIKIKDFVNLTLNDYVNFGK